MIVTVPSHLQAQDGQPASFDISEPESYRKDVPDAEVHVIDARHFALNTAADRIAELVRGFVKS